MSEPKASKEDMIARQRSQFADAIVNLRKMRENPAGSEEELLANMDLTFEDLDLAESFIFRAVEWKMQNELLTSGKGETNGQS